MDGWWGKSGRCIGVDVVEFYFRHARLVDEMRIVLLLQMDTSIDNTWNTTQRESQGKMEAEKKHRSRAYKIEKHRI